MKPGRQRHEATPLARSALPVDTAALARFLIGKLLVRELPEGAAIGRIVETEAYVIGDAAGHAYGGMTPRNRSLFLKRGHAYLVYLAYGVSFMSFNVSRRSVGTGCAGVLIRASSSRSRAWRSCGKIEALSACATSPEAREGLPRALSIDRSLDGLDLCQEGPLWLARDDRDPGEVGEREIGESVRIGISRDAKRVLRFYVRGSPFVSGARSLNA